ncbi:MAG TPA: zf-HC2 domain-containing protein [Microbacterium sp.]|uniref:anti-sigma factor family protein n=1 Tax=Microbacterium sp. TaxID=51671 RepID=UPI002B474255|nr:zf-HC2 domain-containing protein [Microbacterium sp.]HKT56973.1 zf-HC2 domain-containing protein [Microbacterium sp.]
MTAREDTARDHERFRDWDAAYLLGALSPADRRAYEEHVADCPICAAAVGDLAGVPALLGILPREQAMALLEGGSDAAGAVVTHPAPDLVPALLGRVRRIRRRRRWTTAVVAAVAAVAVVALTLFVPAALTEPNGTTVTASLQAANSASRSPLSADVTLTAQKWGTSIGMVCRWDEASGWAPSGTTRRWDYGLWIVTADGRSQRVATWSAGPGDVVRTTDSTDAPIGSIVRLELRSIDGKTVLLSAVVNSTS